MQYYLHLTSYKLCFLVDHSFPSVVFPFVILQSMHCFLLLFNSLYILVIIPHKSLSNYHFLQLVKQILCKCILCKLLYTFVDGNKL